MSIFTRKTSEPVQVEGRSTVEVEGEQGVLAIYAKIYYRKVATEAVMTSVGKAVNDIVTKMITETPEFQEELKRLATAKVIELLQTNTPTR